MRALKFDADLSLREFVENSAEIGHLAANEFSVTNLCKFPYKYANRHGSIKANVENLDRSPETFTTV